MFNLLAFCWGNPIPICCLAIESFKAYNKGKSYLRITDPQCIQEPDRWFLCTQNQQCTEKRFPWDIIILCKMKHRHIDCYTVSWDVTGRQKPSSGPHDLNQCSLFNRTIRNRLHWNLNPNITISPGNAIKNVICKMAAILFQPQCVDACSGNRAVRMTTFLFQINIRCDKISDLSWHIYLNEFTTIWKEIQLAFRSAAESCYIPQPPSHSTVVIYSASLVSFNDSWLFWDPIVPVVASSIIHV